MPHHPIQWTDATRRLDVASIGRNCQDHIAVVDAYPAEDSKTPLVHRLVVGGGQGGTSACCVSRLGGRSAVVGTIGDDTVGRWCTQQLRDQGVDTRYLKALPDGMTPVAYITITRNTGARTIVYEPSRLPPADMQHVHAVADIAAVLLIAPDATSLAADLAPMAPRPKIIYDAERWRTGMPEMMMIADWFVPTAGFLSDPTLALDPGSLPDRIIELAGRVAGQLVVTAGKDGAFAILGNRLVHVPAPDARVADTLGAGDVFHGALALATARCIPKLDAIRFAVAAATLSCTGYGGRSHLPALAETLSLAASIQVLDLGPAAAPTAESIQHEEDD